MIKMKQLLSFFLFAVILLSAQLSFGQGSTTAAINGIIDDQNGNPLPGANIIAVHIPSGTQYGTTSREDGRYNLFGLRVGGPYKVTVSFVGFTSQVEEGFNLALSQTLSMNFQLSEKAVELSGITVSAEKGAVFSAARTGAAQNVTSKQIQEIPTISRSFAGIAKLSPLFSGEGSQAAGRSNRFNNIQIDGTQYNDLFGLGSTGTPGGQTGANPISLDAISEFQVVVAPYDVRLSGFTGGGINAITRSGGNKYNGSVYFFGRNESFVGKYKGADDYPDFKEYQVGVRAGGPIIKDQLFFFLNAEMTADDNPISNAALTQGTDAINNANRAKADKFASLLKNNYGYDAGSYESYTRERPSKKLFIRFDYNLADNHKLTLRHNFVDSYQDNLNQRTSNNSMSFDSYNYRIKNNTNSTVLQLNSTFSNNMSNELILGYTRIRDRRAGNGVNSPEIEVRDGGLAMFAGPDRFSSANELDQDVFEFTDNFSISMGDHVFTLGTHNEFFSFRNLFVRSFFGYWQFNSLTDFENGKPAFFQKNFSRTSDPNQAAEFSVAQLGFYLQDEWNVTPKLKLTIGARVDIPTFPETPMQNDSVAKYFPEISTTDTPSGNLLFSPRVGFNYDISGDRTTQLRGGVGVFTGRIPYVWISNNYGNSGMLYAEVRNASSGLDFRNWGMNPYVQPGVGSPGTGAARLISEINVMDKDLKLPQILRFNVGLDNQLPLGFIGTVEFQYSKTINDMLYRKLNIKPAVGNVPIIGSGLDGRPIYGGTDGKNNNFTDVLQIYNTSGGYQYNLVFQAQRNVARGLSVNAGYVYGQSKDRNSVNSSQANSQMRYNPVKYDANNPDLVRSQYEVEHRTYMSLSYVHEFFEDAATTFSLYYNGQSGSPFSFNVSGVLNGDGFDQNDLFYIPRNSSEILLGTIVNNQYKPAAPSMWNDLNSFIENNDYLSSNRGKIAERNGASNPWRNILDFRLTQDIPDLWGMGKFQVSLDILNVLNLLNSEWGYDESVFSTYNTVTLKGKVTYEGKKNAPVYEFSKPARNVPWTINDLTSRWAMQLGVRYSI
ncbi:MAG: carboxypeptidase regulatory-like domain-containing protein [Ignavibacteriaceae bacterium]|jgi:outer membrane receptor protein involved in Fe transport|nr:carboxypeptidase regulatory-like domain-containing protein [Ignavibacteriaceae bacterium]